MEVKYKWSEDMPWGMCHREIPQPQQPVNFRRGFQLSKQTKVLKSYMADRVYISCIQTIILWIYDDG